MLYLICRTDQVPMNLDRHRPFALKPSQFYPRFVNAENAEDAVDKAFHPEPYKPGGARDLVVIELGEIYEFTAMPIPPPPPPPTYTLHLRGRGSKLNVV